MSVRSVVTGVVPTFLLRGVDPNQVLERYRQGYYQTITVTKKVPNTDTPIRAGPVAARISSDPEEGTYAYRTKSNTTQMVATTNVQNYITFVQKKTEQPLQGGRCRWCGRTFTHTAVGIPLRMVIEKDRTVVYYDDVTDRYECALALWKHRYNDGARLRDPRYMNGGSILRHLYALQYPQAGPLREAPDPNLLKCNGGSLEDWEYDNGTHVYETAMGIIWAPCKLQYLRY